MSLAITLPDEYAPQIESGDKTYTFQLQDELKVGDVIDLIAGGVTKKVRIVDKRWIPEMAMDEPTRHKISAVAPPREKGFSGAFHITFEYIDQPDKGKYSEDVDKIAEMLS
jgi:hypothetical protein